MLINTSSIFSAAILQLPMVLCIHVPRFFVIYLCRCGHSSSRRENAFAKVTEQMWELGTEGGLSDTIKQAKARNFNQGPLDGFGGDGTATGLNKPRSLHLSL